MSIPKGSKLRRSRALDPSHKSHRIYRWISTSGFRRLKSQNFCNGTRKIMKREVSKGRKDLVGHRISKVDRWRTINTESNSIDHFEVLWGEVPNSLH